MIMDINNFGLLGTIKRVGKSFLPRKTPEVPTSNSELARIIDNEKTLTSFGKRPEITGYGVRSGNLAYAQELVKSLPEGFGAVSYKTGFNGHTKYTGTYITPLEIVNQMEEALSRGITGGQGNDMRVHAVINPNNTVLNTIN